MTPRFVMFAVLPALMAASPAFAASLSAPIRPQIVNPTVTYPAQGNHVAMPTLHNNEMPVTRSSASGLQFGSQPAPDCLFCGKYDGGVGWHPG